MPTKAVVQTPDNLWAVSYNSEYRYFTWRNTRGSPTDVAPLSGRGSGSQFYSPMALSITGTPSPEWKLDFVLRGGWVSSSQTTAGNRGSVNTMTDTQFSSTVTYNGINGVQPYVALLMNLPTGKAALYGSSRFARMDGDLVDVGAFGEGFNVGPTVGVNIAIAPTVMASLSAGYTFRGRFDKEAADPITGLITATDSVKNGNEGTVTAALGYSEGPFSTQGSISYSWDSESIVNSFGMPDFNRYRSGPRVTVSGSASYMWSPQWSSSLNGFWTHSDRNDVLDPTGTMLIPEAMDSNSDVYRLNSGLTYNFGNGITAGPTASYLYRNHNSYDANGFGFLPAKTRWSVGATAAYDVTNKINLTGRIERIWTRENVNPGPPAFAPVIPDMSGDAWQFSAGGTVIF